jgi:methyltransferase (TIGR00027 family)
MRAGNRSRTSDWVAALRALYSEAPPDLAIFDDGVAQRLLPEGLARTVRWISALPLGTRAAHRLIGAATWGLSYGVPLRTAAIDSAVVSAVDAGARQLVLLGAGLDARAWRMPRLAEVTVYELDHPDTQAYKRARTTGLEPLAREVRFCAIDFERRGIADALAEHDFDPGALSVWVWEGVTMYLTPEAIDATLEAVSTLSVAASALAMTYLPRDYGPRWQQLVGSGGAKLIGEPLRGAQTPEELRQRLERHGFELSCDDSAIEWAERWPEADARRVRPYERLAVAARR